MVHHALFTLVICPETSFWVASALAMLVDLIAVPLAAEMTTESLETKMRNGWIPKITATKCTAVNKTARGDFAESRLHGITKHVNESRTFARKWVMFTTTPKSIITITFAVEPASQLLRGLVEKLHQQLR